MRSLRDIRNEIDATWEAICLKAGVAPDLNPYLPESPHLLGTGAKTIKGEKERWVTAIIYMSPAWELWGSPEAAKGRTLCPFATGTGARIGRDIPQGCIDSCLGKFAGRMVMSPVKNARRWKAALYRGNRFLWEELLTAEIDSFRRGVARRVGGWRAAVRIDGATDTGAGVEFARLFPDVQLYDYTKVSARAMEAARGKYPSNYSVTFSFSGTNWDDCKRVLEAGGNVAAVFGGPIPESIWGFRTFDADETDLRFLDSERGAMDGIGRIAALKLKAARNLKQATADAGLFLIDNPRHAEIGTSRRDRVEIQLSDAEAHGRGELPA